MDPKCEPSAERPTVILVEDNELVRETTMLWLEKLDFRVLTATDGPAALRLLKSGAPVDLLLTDVVMPGGMSGQDLVDLARRHNSRIRVLMMSGHPWDDLVSSGKVGRDVTVLTKPFQAATLADAVHDAMGQPAA